MSIRRPSTKNIQIIIQITCLAACEWVSSLLHDKKNHTKIFSTNQFYFYFTNIIGLIYEILAKLHCTEIVSEYDQGITKSQTADNPMAPRGRALNHQETPGRQTKQINQFPLPHQDDCNTRMDTMQRTTKHRTTTDSHNKQKVNNNRTTTLKRTAAQATGGLNAPYWHHVFALDSAAFNNLAQMILL